MTNTSPEQVKGNKNITPLIEKKKHVKAWAKKTTDTHPHANNECKLNRPYGKTKNKLGT